MVFLLCVSVIDLFSLWVLRSCAPTTKGSAHANNAYQPLPFSAPLILIWSRSLAFLHDYGHDQ